MFVERNHAHETHDEIHRADDAPVFRVGGANAAGDPTELIAKEFSGTYHFYYLFSESGTPYVDVPGHLQLLEADRHDGAPRVSFFNLSGKGTKHAHYSYVFHQKEDKLILRELDGGGKFRFDCGGTFQREKIIRVLGAGSAETSARHRLADHAEERPIQAPDFMAGL